MTDNPTRDVLERRITELEQEIRALAAREEQLRFAFEATGDGLWEFVPETGVLRLGPGWYTMLGYAPGELPASYETWFDLLHPDDRTGVADGIEAFLAGRAAEFSSEFRMRTKGGGWRWIHSRGGRFVGDEGGPFRLIGTHVDVTARKELESQLLRMQFSIDNASLGIFWIDETGRVLNANRQACRSLGYTREELCRLSVPDFDPSFTARSFPEHRRKVQARSSATIETTHRRKDGTTFPVEITISYHEYEGQTFSVSFQTDISERKLAQETIADRELRLESIFRASPAGIGLVAGRILTEVNDRFCGMTGYSREELVGQDTRILYPDPEAGGDPGPRKARRLLEGGRGTLETVMKAKDGRLFDVLMSASPLNPDDPAQGIAFTALDITEQKRAERERAQIEARFRQAQKVEAVGQLAGGVAHDLNNLLSPIIGFADVLLQDTAEGDPRRQGLEQIMKAGSGARDLVRQLLAFSRKQTLEYTALDLNATLAGFETLLRRTIREDIEIEFVKAPDLPPVMADVGQVEQVIMNLAINGSDAMPSGGRLTIETRIAVLDEDFAARNPGASAGPHVVLAFTDTGHGMDSETCARVFEPFFSTKGRLGTGLGLSTVYGIVKQHRGNILVHSAVDRGSTFEVYLPVTEGTVVAPPAPSPRTAGSAGAGTILLVEDNPQVRQVTEAILGRLGYAILSAEGGEAALRVKAEHPGRIDLLLTDVIMPGMNGRELHRRMAAEDPGLKVLYMSGYTDDVIAHHGVVDPGVHFIQKPFVTAALARKVREVLTEGA